MMKKLIIALVMLVVAASPALAFDLGGYTGPVIFKYADFSTGTTYSIDPNSGKWIPGNIVGGTYGNANTLEDAWGIAKITSIDTADGLTQLWSELSSNEQLTVMYYGIDDDYLNVYGNGFEVRSVGGHMDVYLQNKAGIGYTGFDSTGGPGVRGGLSSYPTVTDGSLFLSADFVPGLFYGDSNTTNDHITYRSLFDPTQPGFLSQSQGDFYLSLTGGSYMGMFDSNGFVLVDDNGVTHYIDLEASFRGSVPGSNGWLVNSQDPVQGRVIPEPASMILMGIGLLGAVRLRRRTR